MLQAGTELQRDMVKRKVRRETETITGAEAEKCCEFGPETESDAKPGLGRCLPPELPQVNKE